MVLERESRSHDLISQHYGEMRVMARRILSGNSLSSELQPTELANEVAFRLLRSRLGEVQDKGHFLALTARAMRQILIDEARKAGSVKRASPPIMTRWPMGGERDVLDIEALDDAEKHLANISPERGQIVELRFMLGLTVEETALYCGLSERSVKRRWQSARAWLLNYLSNSADVAPA